jgi:hypothetical protein
MNSEADRKKIIAEKICNALGDESECEFITKYVNKISLSPPHWVCRRAWRNTKHPRGVEYPSRGLGEMYVLDNLDNIFFEVQRRIRWPEDWIDPNPIYIDDVFVFDNFVVVRIYDCSWWKFMCVAYYAIHPVLGVNDRFEPPIDRMGDFESPSETIISRRDYREKAARFIPAAIKDIEVYLKSLRQALEKYNIEKSGLREFPFLRAELSFSIQSMGDDEIVENALKRASALAEHRWRMRREWFPSDERRQHYESTMLHEDDPFRKKHENRYRYLVRYPYGIRDSGMESWAEHLVRERFERQMGPVFVYNLEGYSIELIGYEVDKYGRKRGGELIINKNKKLEPFPLERIGFLRDDFPELFR